MYLIEVFVYGDGDSTSTFEIISVDEPNFEALSRREKDVDDYNALGTHIGLCASDSIRDSIVDFSDLLMVINDWGIT